MSKQFPLVPMPKKQLTTGHLIGIIFGDMALQTFLAWYTLKQFSAHDWIFGALLFTVTLIWTLGMSADLRHWRTPR